MVMLMVFGVYGISAFVSVVVKRERASLLAVIISLFAAIFCGYGPTLRDAKDNNLYFLWAMQFNMWGAQTQFSETLKIYKHVYDNKLANEVFGYDLDHPIFDFMMMFAIGCCWRVVGYLAMIFFNKKKQN